MQERNCPIQPELRLDRSGEACVPKVAKKVQSPVGHDHQSELSGLDHPNPARDQLGVPRRCALRETDRRNLQRSGDDWCMKCRLC